MNSAMTIMFVRWKVYLDVFWVLNLQLKHGILKMIEKLQKTANIYIECIWKLKYKFPPNYFGISGIIEWD